MAIYSVQFGNMSLEQVDPLAALERAQIVLQDPTMPPQAKRQAIMVGFMGAAAGIVELRRKDEEKAEELQKAQQNAANQEEAIGKLKECNKTQKTQSEEDKKKIDELTQQVATLKLTVSERDRQDHERRVQKKKARRDKQLMQILNEMSPSPCCLSVWLRKGLYEDREAAKVSDLPFSFLSDMRTAQGSNRH